MLDLSHYINLPLFLSGIIVLATFLYVVLDGFGLGIGILFPFAPTNNCRNTMMSSIIPVWDGNETWLVLGGITLFAAFPLAYSLLISSLYIPVICMVLSLVLRGVAFEFRFKSSPQTIKLWDYCFHFGSLGATFFQGAILGAFIQGIDVKGKAFVGSYFDWLTAFPIFTGIALIVAYALLGSTWLIIKAEDHTQQWAQKSALYILPYVLLSMGLTTIWTPLVNQQVFDRWFSLPNIIYLLPIPVTTLFLTVLLFKSVLMLPKNESRPFLYAILLFTMHYIGLIISLWPWIIPYGISYTEAAATATTQSFVLLSIIIFLPFILAYTALNYYVFSGKTTNSIHY